MNDVPGKKVTVVQLKDGCGNLLSDTVISFVRYPLQVKFLGDTVACTGDSVRLFVEASGGDTGAYQFIWNDGSNKGSQIVDFPKQSKKYFVTLKYPKSREVELQVTATIGKYQTLLRFKMG